MHKGFGFLRWDGFVLDRNLIAASYASVEIIPKLWDQDDMESHAVEDNEF